MVVVRGNDLVVAVGSELRIASLADVKSQTGEDDAAPLRDDSAIGDYKVRLSLSLSRPSRSYHASADLEHPRHQL